MAQIERLSAQRAKFLSFSRTKHHPCDRSELGWQIKRLKEQINSLKVIYSLLDGHNDD